MNMGVKMNYCIILLGWSMKYLKFWQRNKIEALFNAHVSKREMAAQLGVSLQTVYNELRRGMYEHERNGVLQLRYSADKAQADFNYRQTAKGRSLKLASNWDFVEFVEAEVFSGCSPSVALKRWNKKGHEFTVSIPTLYRYMDLGYFPNLTNKHLPEKSKRKKREYAHIIKRFPKGTIIEERPAEIASRSTVGDWELDLVVGPQRSHPCLMVLTERKTRLEVIRKIPNRKTETVCKALDSLYSKYHFKTITCDNGAEFQDWKRMEHTKSGKRRLKVYYCHPYCSSERGSNERMNRMIRRFFPKGTDFTKVTQKRVQQVQDWLNNYERKILDWQTPQFLWSYCS